MSVLSMQQSRCLSRSSWWLPVHLLSWIYRKSVPNRCMKCLRAIKSLISFTKMEKVLFLFRQNICFLSNVNRDIKSLKLSIANWYNVGLNGLGFTPWVVGIDLICDLKPIFKSAITEAFPFPKVQNYQSSSWGVKVHTSQQSPTR